MSLIYSDRKILTRGDILTLSFQHGNNPHAFIVTNGDVVATPHANKVAIKIDPVAAVAYVEMDNKGQYTCYFASIEAYNELVRF